MNHGGGAAAVHATRDLPACHRLTRAVAADSHCVEFAAVPAAMSITVAGTAQHLGAVRNDCAASAGSAQRDEPPRTSTAASACEPGHRPQPHGRPRSSVARRASRAIGMGSRAHRCFVRRLVAKSHATVNALVATASPLSTELLGHVARPAPVIGSGESRGLWP